MQAGWRVGSLFNIPLFINPSWFFILALVTLNNGQLWQNTYQSWNPWLTWGAALGMALLLFGSVLVHELGHSLVARAQGIKVNSITLFMFGGIASIDQESSTPGQAFQVAIAGPAVSLTLFGLLSMGAALLPMGTPLQVMALSLARINCILALFNLIPGLPLDGGQIFKAAVWKITGNRLQGVRWAATTGGWLGWLAIVAGVALFGITEGTSLWLALLGWFGIRNAKNYERVTDLQEALLKATAAEAMTRGFRVVDANLTLRQFADDYLLSEARSLLYFAASDGRYRGLVHPEELQQIERSLWDSQTLQDIVQPLTDIVSLPESATLVEVINLMEEQELRSLTVLSPAGAVAGVIDRGDIVRAIATKLNMAVSDSTIQRIKDEGVYPPGLQLSTLAKATDLPKAVES